MFYLEMPSHPNVVQLLGSAIDAEGALYLVYPYYAGGSLEARVGGKLIILDINNIVANVYQVNHSRSITL